MTEGVQSLDPRGQARSTASGEVTSLPELAAGLRLSLLSNAKPPSGDLMAAIAARAATDGVEARVFEKRRTYEPAPPELLEEIRHWGALTITGAGT